MNTLSQYLLVLAYLIKSMDLYITGAITSDEVATSYRISNIYIPGSKGTDRPEHATNISTLHAHPFDFKNQTPGFSFKRQS
jgi:hypothetical protein